MSPIPDRPRVRKFHHKNRGGCVRCRQRHVRCDQTHPRCLACSRLGYSCEWPPPIFQVSISNDVDELRSFQYYRENTLSEIQGFDEDGFWDRDLLRLSYHDCVLKHLLVALSGLDEAYRLRAQPGSADVARRKVSFSLSRYQSAIEGLRSRLEDEQDMTIVLTSCIICACVELWQGDSQTARKHIAAGYAIALEHGYIQSQSKAQSKSVVSVLHVLWRMGKQMSIPEHQHILLYKLLPEIEFEGIQHDFEDMSDARATFYRIARSNLCPGPNQLTASGISRFIDCLDDWYDHFVPMANKKTTSMHDYHILAMHYYVIRTAIEAVINEDETYYDKHLPDFEQIIAHCNSIKLLRARSGAKIDGGRSADARMMMALVFVALKCRSPLLRRSALRLLYRSRRFEGVFSAVMLGTPTEQLMMLEEEDCTEEELQRHDIPPNIHRLSLDTYSYEPGILASTTNENTAYENWAREPPKITFAYRPSYTSFPADSFTVVMQPFASQAGFGLKSTYWFPISKSGLRPLFDTEVPRSTRAVEGSHGSHLPHVAFRGRFRNDMLSVVPLQFLSIFEDW